VKLAEGSLDAILTASGGDMRKAVTYLQSAHQLTGGSLITPDLLIEISGKVTPSVMVSLWSAMSKFDFEGLRQMVLNINAEGYPIVALLTQLHEDIMSKDGLNDVDKAFLNEKIAVAEQNLIDGSSEYLQLLDVTSLIMRRLNGFTADVDTAAVTH
jgi:replication factor C subunit 2/4